MHMTTSSPARRDQPWSLQRPQSMYEPASDAQSKGLSDGDDKASKESSNSSGGGTSVAASVAVDYTHVDNEASVANGVSLSGSGHVEVHATARAQPAHEPREHRRGGVDAGQDVDEGDADLDRRTVGFAGDALQPDEALHDRVVARELGVAAVLAEARDRAHDQA